MRESIKEIKDKFAAAREEALPDLMEYYQQDERSGVQRLIKQQQDKQQRLVKEYERIEEMCYYEKKHSQAAYICGIDEVGRGPLAGPVVAGAVILPKDARILYVNDSKKLSEKKREELHEVIMAEALYTGLGVISPERIDEINILQATYEAMREAVAQLGVVPEVLLNDAVIIPGIDAVQERIIKGDAKSLSIASASIIAKVTRDKMMEAYARIYPEYGFEKNKGYGTPEHIEAIKKYGPTPIHRRSFIGNFIL